jgi:hypothetical protein
MEVVFVRVCSGLWRIIGAYGADFVCAGTTLALSESIPRMLYVRLTIPIFSVARAMPMVPREIRTKGP